LILPVSQAERIERARDAFEFVPASVDALVLFDEQYVQYYSGFIFIPTERPIGLVLSRDGARTLFVPRLEREHALETCQVEHVLDYPEYPGERHPLLVLVDYLRRQGIADIGVDHDGYPPVAGYRRMPLSDLLQIVFVSADLDRQLALKSEHELELIRESIRWGDVAHRLLQEYTAPGLTENQVVARACKEATEQMIPSLGSGYRRMNPWIAGALAIYRGQIGPNSALPHAMTNDATFRVGDTLVTGAGADVWGYLSELERTMFVGEPSALQRRYFEHMLNLQDIAFEAMKPGVRCADVDRAVQDYYQREGLSEGWRHHVGHSLGQRIHESPFLDIGDETELQPGMVFSIEPGIYVPGLGGFRHSDTVLVTGDGIEVMTTYPRDLDSLIIPAD
jgi:Xaa-Pro dipeptidase